MGIKRVLCVCKGNSDRSPAMEAVLRMYLENAGHDVTVESAGILEVADKGGSCSSCIAKAASRIGLDLSEHCKRWIEKLDLDGYDLFVVVDETVANRVLELAGFDKMSKVHNAEVTNPWPSQFQEDHDKTFQYILGAMHKVMVRYFSE